MDDKTVNKENRIDETSMFATLTRANALDTLLHIEKYLSIANKAAEGLKFSSDPDTDLIEKAVLYHRIRTDSQLADRYTTTMTPEQTRKRIIKLHREITEGRDPLAEYIKSRDATEKKVDLVLELTQQDRNKAWFEILIETAGQKKDEAEEIRKKLAQAEEEIRKREESLDKEDQPEEKKQPEEQEPDKARKEQPEEQNKDLNKDEVLQQGLEMGGKNIEKKEKPEEPKPENAENKEEPEKKENKEKPEEVKKDVPQTSAEKLKAEADLIQQGLLNRILENPDCTPKEFLARPENLQALKRLTAIQLHQSQIDQQYNELAQALKYGRTREERIRALQNRAPFEFEKSAAADLEAHLQRLENTTEVAARLQSMVGEKNIQFLASEISWPSRPHPIREHDNLALMEKEMVPGAIREYLNGPDKPKEGSDLEKKLTAFIKKNKDFPDKPTAAECEERIKEYRELMEALKKEKEKTGGGKELSELLGDQIERLEDVTLAPERQKVEFNFKPDSLIEYFDPAHPDEPMDAVEAREKLIRGVKLEQRTFDGDNFVGTSRKVSYDKETGMIKKGPEKLITRVVDLSEKNSLHPELQLEDLKQIREVLKKSDPFYKRNPESFNRTMESLDKVIRTQEKLGPDANIRQVDQLMTLYGELDKNMTLYLEEKGDELKAGGEKANIRSDALQTLQSITNAKHMKNLSEKLYPEQKEFNHQKRIADNYLKIFDKWKKAGPPQDKAAREEFKKDFENVSDGLEELAGKDKDYKYAGMAMNIGDQLDSFVKMAEQVKNSEVPFDEAKLESMKAFNNQSKEAVHDLFAMNPDPQPKKAGPKKEEQKKEKEIEAPKMGKTGP